MNPLFTGIFPEYRFEKSISQRISIVKGVIDNIPKYAYFIRKLLK